MTAQDIRKTIDMLENSSMELVANRDFDLEDTVEKDGVVYALGNTVHDDNDSRKNDYSVYRKTKDGGFEHNGRFYPQQFYVELAKLPVSSYAPRSEVDQAFQKFLAEV